MLAEDVVAGLIRLAVQEATKGLGVEIVDVRLKRIDFVPEISESVYRRMEAERKRVANEQRKKLSHHVKDMGEQARVAIRNVRRDANRQAEAGKKDGAITEDDLKRLQDEIQAATKSHEGKVDSVLKAKSDEIMEI